VPCFNEDGYIQHLLASLLPQLERNERWSLVLVDDSCTDATPSILAAAARNAARVVVTSGRYGSPGAARSAGVAAAIEIATHLESTAGAPPEWLVTVDADVELTADWLVAWDESLCRLQDDQTCGAVNGVELQDHLFADFPNAATVSDAFGRGIAASERTVGKTNLNGVNHAVRASAYATAGPYLQPTAPGPYGIESLAGEDWDLGVRLRRCGYSVQETSAAVVDRGRRLLADVHAYVSGEAYEGPFRRLPTSNGGVDITAAQVPELVDSAIERSLRHFLLKPILAEAVDATTAMPGLSAATLAAMHTWMRQWPRPTFEESRNGFVFGRLPRFSAACGAMVRRDLGLELHSVLANRT
jgi:cellulose synthase/poly-beta-1,6-N-acetylglucosamine synthase-like glycosyltransferase